MGDAWTTGKRACAAAVVAIAVAHPEARASDFASLFYAIVVAFYLGFAVIYALTWFLARLIPSRPWRLLPHALVLATMFAPSGREWYPAAVMMVLDEQRRTICLLSIGASALIVWLVLWAMTGPASDRLGLRGAAADEEKPGGG
ncbi:hypothetical protein J5226_14585 [Lysobacter sp. K5869]|uniref:hypothetical protein n=1 Tax=Lysobacter sp. K5869 TaxID=2820808 RepID=UPI001C061956|nr:hypothetical protein [Lysobacter sp. K5869]QWP74887.1 hypothetical protein J5226_14585 [Lysobacter sp. K5869]